MFSSIKHSIVHNLYNLPGWHTRRRIVVIESDDWGAVRMPDRKTYDALLAEGYRVDRHPYERYDSLAGAEDFTALFEVLTRFRDGKGRHPVITANAAVANPDFEKIREDRFRRYHYEPFTQTLKRYFPGEDVFDYWRQGIAAGIFHPQFHGREHFNIPQWLDRLNRGDEDTLAVFPYGMVGIPPKRPDGKNLLMIGLRPYSEEQYDFQVESLKEGLALFERIFGYKSLSFIAPVYTWCTAIESVLHAKGVEFIQSAGVQCAPDKHWNMHKIRHYTGQRNKTGQYFTVRNCFFEPSQMIRPDRAIAECVSQIANAFAWRKPAIVSSHRLNYIGRIDEGNRTGNLRRLEKLITTILRRWPDVEFMTSDELGVIISKGN